jgi:hypothetical protein
MKPATPVTSQARGADAKCSRRFRYGAEIKRSRGWRVPASPVQGGRAREHDCSIKIAAARGYPRGRDKASSIPVG